MKIGIIIGSVREGRNGEAVARWVHERASSREGVDYQLIDLKSFDVPVFTSATNPMLAGKKYESDAVTAWSDAIDGCDAFIFVTPEYNHGVPGGLKNAVDSLGPEWVGKAIAFVGYGADGGVRSVEQWRQIIGNFSMVDVRAQLALSLFTDFGESGFAPIERRTDELNTLFGEIEAATGRLSA